MRPKLKSCPFCGSHLMLLGPSRAQHPPADCILSDREIAAREFREWNKRTHGSALRHFGYERIVEVFDRNETAGSYLREDGEGGFASGVARMADEIDRLKADASARAEDIATLGLEINRLSRAALGGGQLCSCTVEGAEWQPIETAPKDGTRFLGYWTDIHDNGCDSPAKTWFQDGRWHSPWEDASERDAWAPTHWMPLPVQPQGALDRAAGREGGGE